jgi:hypothetical protein
MLVAVKATEYVPAAAHVTVGFLTEDVAGVPPWKVQLQLVGYNVDASKNLIGLPGQVFCLSELKSTDGGLPAVTEAQIIA